MGYILSSLGRLPIEEDVDFYIFLIDSGWYGGLTEIILQNFEKIAEDIGPRAVIAKGFKKQSWSDEICEKYFGKKYTTLSKFLPALLITDSHPKRLKSESMRLLIPIHEVKSHFGTFDLFFSLLTSFVRDKDPEFLERFKNGTNMSEEDLNILILEPNVFGIGLNVKNLIKKILNWRKKLKEDIN